jgi:pimeloyl-ACP methyl ester carboxylesterase
MHPDYSFDRMEGGTQGLAEGGTAMPSPTPFSIAIPDAVLTDLQQRLAMTRWPDEISGAGWAYGTDPGYLRDLVRHWQGGFDWRAQERALNALPQFTVPLDDITLHFIHAVGRGPAPLPLLLTHGWPSSVADFQRLIPLLTHPPDPADAFTVVAPSLPGHGFSFAPGQKRFSIPQAADLLGRLMTDVLGYARFGAQGADWGAFVATWLGYARPEALLGIHVSLLAIPREPVANPSPEEAAFARQLDHWLREETGYSAIMATKPQTLAYGLTDSPVGLAGWIVEKFRSWTDCGGSLDGYLPRDTLLTNIMLYWATGAINASFWPYYARQHEPWLVPSHGAVTVPTGYAEFPAEILLPPRSLVQRLYPNITRWTRMQRGGHFPALEDPEALAAEIRAFFRPLRTEPLRAGTLRH